MVFVTGGTGLLGTHLLLELLARGEKVRALKRTHSDLNTVQKLFAYYLKDKSQKEFEKIEWIEGDVLDITTLESAVKDCEKVYHCAAMVSFAQRDYKKMLKVNKHGTKNVVNVCLSANISQLIYVSSTAAIGRNSLSNFYTEKNKWVDSKENSNYAVTKHNAEIEVWRGIEEGLNAVIVNPCVILGPGNWDDGSLSIFKVVKRGLKFYTPGKNAFVDVRDVATIMCELSERKILNERFLVISENLFFKTLFEKIALAFGTKAPNILVKPWMAKIAWRIEGALHFFFRKKQNVTKETAQSSMNVSEYSNEKIIEKLNFKFISIDDCIKNASQFFNLNP